MTRWILISFLSFLLILSLGLNIFFLYGKGIHITNTYNQQQYQNQSQAQLLIHMWMAKGKIKWRTFTTEDRTKMNLDSWEDFLNTLSPEQALFAKVILGEHKIEDRLLVPELIEEKNKQYEKNN